MLCLWVYCLHHPSIGWRFLSRQPKLSLKKITIRQILKNAYNPNCSSSIGFDLDARTMTNLSGGFPATPFRIFILFLGQSRSRSLHRLRTVVLFFVELVGYDGCVYNFVESSSAVRHAIVCILFSLEKSQVVHEVVVEVLLRSA